MTIASKGKPRDAGGLRRSDFPPEFQWGCATSAYQIEGAVREGGRGESIWDRFCSVPGHIRDGSSGAVACDHFHQWETDLDIAQALGLNAYRFSIAWPRIFPRGDEHEPNRAGLDFYERLVDGMLSRGLSPWPTLYHWDLPQYLQDQGGWKNRATAQRFADYAETVSQHLGDRVSNWTTHNEPWCTAFLGHHEGVHAPGLRDWKTALQACHHVLLSHGLAVPRIRAAAPRAKLGIALSLHPLRPASASAADLAALRRHDGLRNRWFLDALYGRGYPSDVLALCGDDAPRMADGDMDAISAPTDFLGINYYFPEIIAHHDGGGPLSMRVVPPAGLEQTDFGWEVSPQGMVELLQRVATDYKPAEIFITENGSTYDDAPAADGEIHDDKRVSYLQRHVAAVRDLLCRQVPVKGYFAWSLLDNFEWAEGYLRRFGLVHVDFATQKRRLKDSGRWYQAFLNDGPDDRQAAKSVNTKVATQQ